jgi:hypothetical protein
MSLDDLLDKLKINEGGVVIQELGVGPEWGEHSETRLEVWFLNETSTCERELLLGALERLRDATLKGSNG